MTPAIKPNRMHVRKAGLARSGHLAQVRHWSGTHDPAPPVTLLCCLSPVSAHAQSRLVGNGPFVDQHVEAHQVGERPVTQWFGLPVPADLHETVDAGNVL